ncbi:MAG: protein kinase [Gemmatimonadaceae bacterium]
MTRQTDRLTTALAGRYRIERELGQGGMATVYLAHDVRHDRKVAIKVLKPELAAVLGAERFVQEIKTTAALSHPHILPLFDSGEAGGFLYYVMPYIEGETIREKLNRETQFGIDEAVRITTEVADALDYAHRHGVIHRDIKPENILLHDGRPMVMDFGIALAVSAAAGGRMTETGLSLGTPHYMSPEQATADKAITARSDVYSLASVLYEMLAGEPPHTGGSAQAIIMKIIAEPAADVLTRRKSVPPNVAAALSVALEKLPADRFDSARAFATALETPHFARAGAGHRTASQGSGPADWRQAARHPLTIGIAALAVVSAAIAVRERLAAPAAQRAAEVRFVVNPPAGSRYALSNAGGGLVAISGDGSTLIFAAIDPQGGRRLYARRLDALAVQPLKGTEGPSAAFFSPDGAFVGFWAAGRLQKVAIAGGAPQVVAETAPTTGATWTSGGDIVFSTASSASLQRVPSAGGKARSAAVMDSANGETVQLFPVAAPDGEHVLYMSWGTGGLEDVRIGLLSLSTGKSRRLPISGTSCLGMLDGRLIFADRTGAILAVPVDLATGNVRGAAVPVGIDVATSVRGTAVAALSASGTLAYQDGNQESTLLRVDPKGATPILGDARPYSFPRYSPDGSMVAVTVASGTSLDIWLMNVGTGSLTRLTSGGAVNERPEWSPDGKKVLFRTARGTRTSITRSSIWWQPADGSGPATPLLADDNRDYFEAVMTPDGRNIVYQVDTAGADVMMSSIGGDSVRRPIANTRATEDQARVSPDGQWVAYVTDETGVPQVVVRPISGNGATVQVSVTGGNQPVWARDGRRLFYRADGKFKIAEVSAAPSFHVVSRADFTDDVYQPTPAPHANYDVSPNGRELLVLKGAQEQLVVVHGWSPDLRGRNQR